MKTKFFYGTMAILFILMIIFFFLIGIKVICLLYEADEALGVAAAGIFVFMVLGGMIGYIIADEEFMAPISFLIMVVACAVAVPAIGIIVVIVVPEISDYIATLIVGLLI